MDKLDKLMKDHRPQLPEGKDQSNLIWQKIQQDKPVSLWHIFAGINVAALALFMILNNTSNFNKTEQYAFNIDDMSIEETYAVSDWESMLE